MSQQRFHKIAEAAYYLAEQQQFRGNPVDYWLAAEATIDHQQSTQSVKYGLRNLQTEQNLASQSG